MSEYSPRILPWRDWDEWTATSRLLFAGDGAHRQLGVDRVQAWRARGRIPVAVDSTASLLEVALVESAPGSRSAHELRSMYSMVIIRAINGLVEGQQTKFFAEPVNVLAGRLGLPQWLVDLRHEATHSQLPSLSSLRMGAQQLLDWLFREYWQKQALDLEQSFLLAVRLLGEYKAVALHAQAESPNALSRACREEPSGAAVRTPSDDLLAGVLDRLVNAVSPTFLTAFMLPALVRLPADGDEGGAEPEPSDPYFLLPDERLAASAGGTDVEALRLAWARHRQLYMPLLVRLQRRFPGFARSLRQRLTSQSDNDGGGGGGGGRDDGQQLYGRWVQLLQMREWHSHFAYGRREAFFSLRRAPGISFNLRDKPPENWTQPEADFMAGPASGDTLRRGLGLKPEGRRDGEDVEDGYWAVCEHWTACPIGTEL